MMIKRPKNHKLILGSFVAFVLVGAVCNAFPAFAETIYYTYDDLNRLTVMGTPDAGTNKYEYDEVGNRLSKTFTISTCVPVCPAGFTPEGGICHQPAGCPGGALNAQYDLCIHDIQFGCPAGYAYVSERSRCEGPPVCSGGSYNTAHDHCHKPAIKGCPDDYAYVAARDRCEHTPSCPPGGSYSFANNRCEAVCTYSYTCSWAAGGGGGWNSGTYGDHDTCISNCSQTTACTPKTDPASGSEVYACPYGADHACDGSNQCTRTGTCSLNTACTCPAGYALQGTTCTARAACRIGSLDGDNDVCYWAYTPICDPDWSYGFGKVCYQEASCPSGGLLTPLYNACYTISTTGCNIGYAWNPAISLCSMPPQCPAGSSYGTADDRCETAAIPCR